MRVASVGAGLAAWVGAALSSLCCLLSLGVIVLGLGSGAFMAVTMRYRWILSPAGVAGVITGVLCVRERRRCAALACRMAGSRVTFAALLVASLFVASSIVLDLFPEFTADLLAHMMDRDAGHTGHTTRGTPLSLILAANDAMAVSTARLAVEGMT